MNKKRDYKKCFQCGSDKLWTKPKLAFCLECKKPASTCVTKNWQGIPTGYCQGEDKYCPTPCHHQGKKDYFSICSPCYQKVPCEDRLVDWNWIVNKQKEYETN